MDLRVKRTKQNITNAFLALRSQKPLERISVKELAELAEINKATFYLHYRDVYDLSNQLEDELLERCLAGIGAAELLRPEGFARIAGNFLSNTSLFNTLFSGSRMDRAVRKMEQRFKARIFKARPEWEHDLKINVRLSAAITGCFYAFFLYRDADTETVLSALSEFNYGLWREDHDEQRNG